LLLQALTPKGIGLFGRTPAKDERQAVPSLRALVHAKVAVPLRDLEGSRLESGAAGIWAARLLPHGKADGSEEVDARPSDEAIEELAKQTDAADAAGRTTLARHLSGSARWIRELTKERVRQILKLLHTQLRAPCTADASDIEDIELRALVEQLRAACARPHAAE
jgi:hypothetical protein